MNKEFEKPIQVLINEANRNYPGLIEKPMAYFSSNAESILSIEELDIKIEKAVGGNGIVFLGNFLNGWIEYTITGRKNGRAVKEKLRVDERSNIWSQGWDYGTKEILIIYSHYKGETYTISPFRGLASFVWYYKG